MVSDPIGRVDNADCGLYYELDEVGQGRLLLTEFLTFGTQVGLKHTPASLRHLLSDNTVLIAGLGINPPHVDALLVKN